MRKIQGWILTMGLGLLGGTACIGGERTVQGSAYGPPVQTQSTVAAPPLSATAPATDLETALLHAAPTLRPAALHAALSAWEALQSRGEVARTLLTVIDYGLPSTAKRLWVFDLSTREVLYHELVSHGKNTGENLAESFSNEEGTLMTSLGSFLTGATYVGRNGYSLRLRGMDAGVNDQAESRTIVMHGAPYVSESFARTVGRLGRSHGCPAVRAEIARPLIDRIKEHTLLYAWHPSLQPAPIASLPAR